MKHRNAVLIIVVRYEGGGFREISYPIDTRWGGR